MKQKVSLFWPLILITIGVLLLLSNLGVISLENLWGIAYLWPVFLIVLGLGLILRPRWKYAWDLVGVLIVIAVILGVIFAPYLGLTPYGSKFTWLRPVNLSGNVMQRDYPVQNFETISISVPSEITIQQSETEKLTIEADEALLDELRVEVVGKRLEVDTQRRLVNWRFPASSLNIQISVKDLNEVQLSGMGELHVGKLTTDRLKLDISGVSEAEFMDLNVEDFDCFISGSGKVKLSGQTQQMNLEVSGLGNVDGENFRSQFSEVEVSGAGEITIWVVEKLDVEISGASKINYYGSPVITKEVSGAGNLVHKGDK